MSKPDPRPHIAIVGSGISGLAAAWLLGDTCKVTVFERRATLGLGSQGEPVETADEPFRVDIPPRVFNAGHYRAMMELLDDVGMPTYEISQQPSFTDQDGRPYLAFKTSGSGAESRTMPRLHPRTWGWLGRHGGQLYRWHRFVQNFDKQNVSPGETLASALTRLGFSQRFCDSFLYPMWALMCTCHYEHLDAFPARPVLELARNFAGNFATLRFKGGTRALEARLQQRIDATALGRTVTGVEQHGDRVRLHTAGEPEPAVFNHVVLATDPQSTARLLQGGQWEADHALIAQVPVHETEMILHTDTSSLPHSMRSPVTLHYDAARRRSSATLWMNPIEYERPSETLLQSWEPAVEPDKDKVRARRVFQRTLMNLQSQQAMAQLRENLQRDSARRLWYVGSYLADGVPLLENGVQSARLVAGVLLERLAQAGQQPQARTA